MVDAPAVPSAYFGESEIDDLQEFDDFFRKRDDGTWSRSEEIKRAMRTHLLVEQVFDDADFDPGSERDREAAIQQALYDLFRE